MAKQEPPLLERVIAKRHKHVAVMLDRAIDEIEDVIAAIKTGDFADVARVPNLKRDMMAAAKQLRDAEIEFDAQRQRNEGGVPGADAPMDLDAARRSIGGRLDSLRAAAYPGDVSG
ncbi:MAG: hypothetical protein AAF841_02940 [Pseudomonadota bacterium]